MKEYNLQRKDASSWDALYMAIALLMDVRSKDPSTRVGAVIVSQDNRILSTGYNGAPNGFEDKYFPWGREGEELETKYPYVIHAERNAILNFRGNTREFNGAKLYVSLFPCNECAKELIQVGIKEVIYLSDKYADTNSVKAAKRLFDATGVKYTQRIDLIEEIEDIFKLEIEEVKNLKKI